MENDAELCGQLLLDAGAPVKSRDVHARTPLMYLAALKKVKKPNPKDEPVIYTGPPPTDSSVVKMMKMVVSKGAEVCAQDKNGRTSLHLACMKVCQDPTSQSFLSFFLSFPSFLLSFFPSFLLSFFSIRYKFSISRLSAATLTVGISQSELNLLFDMLSCSYLEPHLLLHFLSAACIESSTASL